APRPLMGGETVHDGALEAHRTGVVPEGAAEAIHQGTLAGAVGADEPQPRARRHLEPDRVERHESAKALREILDLEQGRSHRRTLRRTSMPSSPTMPFGAAITNRISSRPTISRLISG